MNKFVLDKMYAQKKAYVEDIIGAMLKPIYDFGSIQYARDAITGEEYVKLTESNGQPWFINVTGNSESAIGKEVCRMVGEKLPVGLVTNKSAQIQINRLFGGR